MSQENVQVVKRGVDAFRRGDIDAFLDELSEEVVFDYSAVRGPYRGIYEGREGAREILAVFRDAWEAITPMSTEYIEVGDKIVLALRARFQGRGSGVEVDGGGMGAILSFQNGKIVRYRQCQTKAEAVEAARLEK
jgi:ketosteroid isomerase-like protein